MSGVKLKNQQTEKFEKMGNFELEVFTELSLHYGTYKEIYTPEELIEFHNNKSQEKWNPTDVALALNRLTNAGIVKDEVGIGFDKMISWHCYSTIGKAEEQKANLELLRQAVNRNSKQLKK